MSTLLKKLYAEPPSLQAQTIEDYYSNFAKALRQLQEEPEGEMTAGTPFFYVTDFQFSNGTAPLIWVGSLNTSWKQYYKEMRRDGGFAGGTAIKSTEIGKESIPYKFIIEEGKGAKKGYLQAVRKEVKKQISKNIEFVLQTDDNEDEALTEDISKIESSKSSLFERIRQAAVKYKNINVAEAPLLKMELRLQLADLLKQWEELKGSEKTSEQKKFITEFSGYFRMGDTLYRDRAFELLGLQKKAEMAFKGCSASKAEALKTYNDALSQNNNNAREQLRADYKELYLEWLDLDGDLNDILKKHSEYFEQTQYLSIPTEGLQVQESVERNCQKLQKVVKTELERTKINFLNLGGNESDLVPPQAPTGNLLLPPLSDNQHPKLKEVLGDYNELLGDFQKGGGSNGEQLQQQMLKINEWAFIQNQEWIPQISGLRSNIALLKDELYDLEHSSTTDRTESKLNKQITALKEKLQKQIEQLNELLGKQSELSKLQEQMYYARKELALTGKIDREYAAVLDAYERFNSHSNAYIEKKKAPQPLLGGARMMVPFIEAAQDAIDFLEARIQTWQEANTDLKRLETKTKNKNVEKIRSEIRAFAIEHKVFIFKYNEGEYEPQPYVPEEDELYMDNVQPLINNHKKERDALIEEIIRKSDKHEDNDEKKYFERRSERCNPRIKILREALENIGDWRISVRAFEVNTRLQSRLDRAESTEEAIQKELTVLQSLIEIDLITKNANKAVEKRIGLMEERAELERAKNKLAQVKTETLKDKKLEQYQKNLSDVTHKLYRNQAIQYRLSLSAVEGMKGCQLYIDRIKENLDGNDDLLDSLTAWNKKQSQGAGTVGKDFIEHIVHGFKKEYQEILTLIKDDKEKLDALQHLQHRIAPFYVGLSRGTFETDSNATQQLQILLLNIQGTVDDLNGNAGGVSLLGEAIEQKYNTIKNSAPGTVLVEGLQLLLQSIDEWEKQHAHRETDRAEYWWGKLELIRKEILQRLQRDDIEAFRRILDVRRAIRQCRQYIGDATETLSELSEPLDDKAKAIQTKIAQLKTTLDQFDQRANQVRTLPDANLLLSGILADALTPLRDNLKELMLLQMESPNVINKEKETFAALGDGFDMYRHRGMVIPNDEQKKINELGTRMTNRVHKLMKLGISPEELMPRLSHVPFTLLPNDLIPEMLAFKQVRPDAPVVEKAWEGYKAKATKKNIEKVTKLFSQVVIGNRDAVTELFAKSAYYAKMLIVVYATAGDQLALQYCLHRGIAPADLDNELYSKKVLFDYLLECSEEKMGEIEKAILGSPDPKAQAQKDDSFKMPELEKDLAEKIKALPKELKSLLVSAGKKVQGLFKTIEKTITKVVEKVSKKLPKLQLALGSTINKGFLELEKDDVVQLEEIIGLFEEYNKIITQTAAESTFKAFFSKFEPLNALKALKQSLMDYRKSAEELLQKLQRELFEASQKSPDEVLTLGSTHTPAMELLQKRLLQLRIITELYELFEI